MRLAFWQDDDMNVLHDHRNNAITVSRRRVHTTQEGGNSGRPQNNSIARRGCVWRLHTVALSFALLLATPLFARNKTDIIVMNNGDRFTCEIKGLDSGILYVGFDYIAGTISVDWSKVHHLESTQSFLVKTEDGSAYSGMLNTIESASGQRPMELRISETPEESVVVAQPQLVQLTQTSNQFWKRLNGTINSGTTYSKGNEAFQYQLNASVQYPRERWSAGGAVSSTLSSSTGSTVSTRNSLNLDALHSLRWNNWFYLGLGNLLQSATQSIQLQSNVSGGIGRYLTNTNRSTISVFGGIAYQNTRYTQDIETQPTQNVAAAMVGANVVLFKFNKTNLTFTSSVFPALSDPGRVYINSDASYYWKLGHNITWNFSFYGNWDTRPPAHFAGSDYGTSSGIGWTFGNR
jgi:Protein of unknown function, DUF481